MDKELIVILLLIVVVGLVGITSLSITDTGSLQDLREKIVLIQNMSVVAWFIVVGIIFYILWRW